MILKKRETSVETDSTMAGKASGFYCVVATILYVAVIFALIKMDWITFANVALPTCLYFLFVFCNRGEKGIFRGIQMVACYGTVVLSGYVFYQNAEAWIAAKNFVGINSAILLLSSVALLMIKERKSFRNLYLSRVLWMVPITCFMLFGLMAVEKLTEVKYGLVLATCCLVIALLISLSGLSKRENLYFDKTYSTSEKVLIGISVMLIVGGAVALSLTTELMSVASVGNVLLLVFAAVSAFLAGTITSNSNNNMIKAGGLLAMVGSSYLVCLMLSGLFHYVFSFGEFSALVISEVIYLIMATFLCLALVVDEELRSRIRAANAEKASKNAEKSELWQDVGLGLGIFLATISAGKIATALFTDGDKYLWIDARIVNSLAFWILICATVAMAVGNCFRTKVGKCCEIGTMISLTVLYAQYCRSVEMLEHYIVFSLVALVVIFILFGVVSNREWKSSRYLSSVLMGLMAYPVLFLVYAFFTKFLDFSEGFWLVVTSVIAGVVSVGCLLDESQE